MQPFLNRAGCAVPPGDLEIKKSDFVLQMGMIAVPWRRGVLCGVATLHKRFGVAYTKQLGVDKK